LGSAEFARSETIMAAGNASLSLGGSLAWMQGNLRISQAVVVALVSLAHLALLFLAAHRVEATRPQIVTPAPISVRWSETPAAVAEPQPARPKQAEPPPPVVKPVEQRRETVTHRPPPPPQRPAAKATPSTPATVENAAPSNPAPADPTPAIAASHNDAPPPVTPPRVDAAYLSNPTPEYPAEARRAHQEGRVLLRVLVAADGHAQEVFIEHGCGISALDAAALAAVRQWRFTPGHRGDTPVEDWVLIPITFKLRT
jgi:protein TonB